MITLNDVKGKQELEREFAEIQKDSINLSRLEAFRQGYALAIEQVWAQELKEKMREIGKIEFLKGVKQ